MKNRLLKFLSLAICIVIICSFVACGDNGDTGEDTQNSLQDETETSTEIGTEEDSQDIATGEPISGTVAHWKFQNDEKYYKGTMNAGDFAFIDLTGNGNTLMTRSEGKGYMCEVFSWTEGSSLESGGDSALYFGNTFEMAQSVCPQDYDPADMEFTGGTYVSGRYFVTDENAPMNNMLFQEGYTIEVIFKVDSNFNNNYNRYVGVFSRQGISNNEPWFSMALASTEDVDTEGYFNSDGKLALQLLQRSTEGQDVNREFGSIMTEQWIHYMVVSEDGNVSVYINGVKAEDAGSMSLSNIGHSRFGWEVGVGRKSFAGESVMNKEYEEGGIRRLFCGAISEIRVIDHAISVEDSLYYAPVNN